ncbi:beta-galactosidase GalB [Autumnicola psychrophila]|uniref:Beta-galactosidase GalB n=1 Tax=Autumnicola psychrophila TaxID=3075592 RepID=A0ABU3DVW0_9FLAO|nr:beta-galactosidase GalB [Zunongwangia sp. F225]MDT0687849.1 beta-galactosidase GalB [Zunongwangia sp. F225]
MTKIKVLVLPLFLFFCGIEMMAQSEMFQYDEREKISINQSWQFMKYDSAEEADDLIYDVRPEVTDARDDKPADAKPTEAVEVVTAKDVLKPWIMPTGNQFLNDSTKHYQRPEGNPGGDFDFVQPSFDDSDWESINLPHDWAIKGPFLKGWDAEVGGGMGRLPSPGVAWYRRKIFLPQADINKSVFLDIDGAMSYAMVWINGELAGGWPYGYSSWRLDITPYLNPGEENQIAIRLDNPPNSSRWYPGGGIYRNVWLVKTNPLHVGQWGTFIKSKDVSEASATLELEVKIDNDSQEEAVVETLTKVFSLNKDGEKSKAPVAVFDASEKSIPAKSNITIKDSVTLDNPRLWGPPPTQTPNLYVAETSLLLNGKIVDQYNTEFGIRSIEFDGERGVIVNGEPVFIKGVNQHHDLGALGAAFNKRAAERQLEKLREMGVNAIRMAHNPPAPELLDLTDNMGFLVVDEMYDSWERKKTPLDFHLIFPEWHEQDLRALIRRDRNNPSVIMWSTGNEVGEQYTGEKGAEVARRLREIANQEDPTRPTTASFNYAKPDMPITEETEVINLNYQGEGIRNAPAYAHLEGINTPPLYPAFHEKFPNKTIISSENAAAVSSRGTYVFPVTEGISAPVSDTTGGDSENDFVSAYGLYTTPFGASPDKVFASIDKHPYVAGGFVWSGWDYLGEPTPYYLSRSSYFGVIDLAGFKKDRFYLYQSRWRPNHPMAHILPHWNWPERMGEITPVHVYTSGDEAELFLNGESLGRKKKGEYEYRLRWDDVVYQPGELKVIAYKNGEKWAEDIVKTTGEPAALKTSAERKDINANGKDLAFITVEVVDEDGLTVPTANNTIQFSVEGPAEIVATDNGDPTNMTPFPSHQRKAFNGKVMVIVRPIAGKPGAIQIKATSEELENSDITIESLFENK